MTSKEVKNEERVPFYVLVMSLTSSAIDVWLASELRAACMWGNWETNCLISPTVLALWRSWKTGISLQWHSPQHFVPWIRRRKTVLQLLFNLQPCLSRFIMYNDWQRERVSLECNALNLDGGVKQLQVLKQEHFIDIFNTVARKGSLQSA